MTSFKSLEFDTWQRGAAAYDALFGSVTRQAIAPVLDALAVAAGHQLLDICCGTGHGVAAALQRGALARGVDLAPAMIATARQHHPNGQFSVGDAEALDFPDHSFDRGLCLFGVNHLPDQPRALAEACRVLRPGGLYAFTMWLPPGRSKFHALVQQAIARHARGDVALPAGSPAMRFGDAELCCQALLQAGFVDPRTRELPLAFALSSARTVVELAYTSPRVSLLLARQSDADRRAIEAAILEAAEQYRCGPQLHIPIPALLSVARKPG